MRYLWIWPVLLPPRKFINSSHYAPNWTPKRWWLQRDLYGHARTKRHKKTRISAGFWTFWDLVKLEDGARGRT